MPRKNTKEDKRFAYKTEEQIKQEALKNRELRRLVEQSRKPKSPFEKRIENFWFHYKGLLLGSVAAVAVAAFFLYDIAFTPKPDIMVIMVTSKYYPQELQDNLRQELEQYVQDINGDGKSIVQIDHIPFEADPMSKEEIEAAIQEAQSGPPDESAMMDMPIVTEEDYAYVTKLMATIAAGQDQVYILDEANYKYLTTMDDESLFLDLSAIQGAEGYALPLMKTRLADAPEAKYYEDIAFYLRNLSPTKKNAASLEGNEQFLKNISG